MALDLALVTREVSFDSTRSQYDYLPPMVENLLRELEDEVPDKFLVESPPMRNI